MINNKKIIILTKSIDGGTGTFALNLIKIKETFTPNTVDIKIIVLEKPSYRKIKNENEIVYLRKKNFYPKKYLFSFSNIINFLTELSLLRKEFVNFNPDLILSTDVHCNLLSYLEKVLFLKNTKLIFTTHINLKETIDNKSDALTNFILQKMIHSFYNKADALVCVSKNLSEEIKIDFGIKKKVEVIYLGLPKQRLNIRKYHKKKIILSVGRLVEQKDFVTLIDSFSLLKNQLTNCELWIIGDGSLKNFLTEYSKTLNLGKEIKFMGWKNNIVPFLMKASIFVLSSKREGFGYVLLEAMSQGLPVISTNAPYGPAEILENGKYGLLIPVGNKTKMKNAMMHLLTNKKAYDFYSKRSIERSMFFSKDKMLLKYKIIIENLID